MSTLSPTANRLRRGLTLAGARGVLREPRRRAIFFWWVLAWLALTAWALMRGYMDDIGLPVHGAATEQALFGSLPTVWLQDHVYPLSPAVFSRAALFVHLSWFAVPWLIGILVSWKKPERIGSFFLWWIALHLLVNPLFALFPLQPPWMASTEVIRILALHTGSGIPDNNPLAAIPSLHVALPLLISFWLFRERWKLPALVMLAYTALVAFEVVFSGEHYVIDVAGAVVVAGAIALAAQVDYRRALSRLSVNLPPVLQGRAALGSDREIVAKGAQPGLTSRPGAIFAVTAALIMLVSIKVTLSLVAGGGFFEEIGEERAASFNIATLDPPTSLMASGGSVITLVWTSSPDSQADGHRVLRGTAAGGPYVEIAQVTPRTVTTFTDTPVAGTYFYVVRSFFENGNSVNSNEASARGGREEQ